MFRPGYPLILAAIVFTASECVAQLKMLHLNTVPALDDNVAMAADNGFLAMATDDEVLVYQVQPDGGLFPAGIIEEPDVRYLEFCNSRLVVCTETVDYECAIVIYDVPGMLELSRRETDDEYHEWVVAHGDRLYVNYFYTELNIFTIDDNGGIVLEAQHEDLPIHSGGIPSCNDELLAVVAPFDAFTMFDIVDPGNPVEVDGYVAYEELYQIGLGDAGVFVNGLDHNPFDMGVRMLRYSGGEFELLSTAGGAFDYSETKTDGDKVLVKTSPYPLFQDRLTLYHVTNGDSISYQGHLSTGGTIDDFVVDGPYVYVRDNEQQQLRVYGIFGPPALQCRLLPDRNLLLSWQEVPATDSYRVYSRASRDGMRSLLLETTRTQAVIPLQAGMLLFDVVSVRDEEGRK